MKSVGAQELEEPRAACLGKNFFTGKGLEMPRELWIPIPGGAQGIPGGGTESSGGKVGMWHSWDVLGGFFHFDSVVLAGVTDPGQLYRH